MPLTDTAIRTAKPDAKPRKLFDGSGLFLLLQPNGARWWRYKYRHGGKEKLISLGTYPETGLKNAREKCADARKLLANGVDPGEKRKAEKAAGAEHSANTFEVIAREWIARQSGTWVPAHTSKIVLRLENDLFPWIGARSIAELTAPDLLACLRRVEARGAVESAHRILQNCSQVFRYAVATGRVSSDPTAGLRGALTPVKPTHRSAITDPSAIGGLMRSIEAYRGSLVTRCALQLAPLVFVRPGELRQAEWAEFDLDAGQWNIPASRMKMREPHLVPLATQAIAILRELHSLTGQSRFVFPSARSKHRPMSNNAVLSALRRMGYAKDEMSGHGFRAMARTILDEVLQIRPDYIEHQLAHAVRDANGRAYNRTTHLIARSRMMQQWADYLDTLRLGLSVVEKADDKR
jgi:integrase